MKGANWKAWGAGNGSGEEDPRATKLREYLESLSPERFPVLIPDVKQAVGLDGESESVERHC